MPRISLLMEEQRHGSPAAGCVLDDDLSALLRPAESGLAGIGFRSGVAYLGRLQWFRRELILIGVPFSSMANVVRLTRPNSARS